MRLLCIMTVLFITLCAAQPGEMMGERPHRQMERLDRYKKIRMVEALKLDDETGLKLVSRYNKHRERVKELEEERSKVIDKLYSQIQSNASEAELQKTFSEYFEIERKTLDSRKKFLDELKEIFTAKQIAEYIVFEREFMRDLRNVVRDVQKERQRKP